VKTEKWVNHALPFLLVSMVGIVLWLNSERQDESILVISCEDMVAGCVAQVGVRSVSLGTDVTIKPLKPFQVWVKAPGAKKVEARFTMAGMDMGFNIYTLRADSQGVFRTSATLPVCVTGRRDWAMTLEIDGTRLAVPFVTDL